MNRFNKPKNEHLPTEAIQDYLDLLLAPTSDPENAVPDSAETTNEFHNKPTSNDQLSNDCLALSDSDEVAHRSVTDEPPLSQKKPVAGGLSGRSRISKAAERIEHAALNRPFAEPPKPLTLKMSFPAIQAPPVIETVEVRQEKPSFEPELTPEVFQETEETEEVECVSEEEVSELQTSRWLDNGRPSWAQERFECLLFTVGGLKLAVPLVELGAIHPMKDELTPLFGQIDWFMGLLTVKGSNIRTINTAKVVMPERYNDAMKKNFSYVISINGVDWGLAIDNISSAITLEPEDIRWRTERSKRPWLAGTVIEHMCALLDISQLTAMFLEQSSNRK